MRVDLYSDKFINDPIGYQPVHFYLVDLVVPPGHFAKPVPWDLQVNESCSGASKKVVPADLHVPPRFLHEVQIPINHSRTGSPELRPSPPIALEALEYTEPDSDEWYEADGRFMHRELYQF